MQDEEDAIHEHADDVKRFYISDSSNSSSNEGNHSDSGEDSDSGTTRFSSGEKTMSWQSRKNTEESDDSPLHSLEDGFQHGPTVQRYMTQYLDHSLDALLLARSTKKSKERRTIKAVAVQISSVGSTSVRKTPPPQLPIREFSFSTGNLSNLSSESPPTTPSMPQSPMLSPQIQGGSGLPPIIPRDTTPVGDEGTAMDRKELRRRKRTHDVGRHWDRDRKHHSHMPSGLPPPSPPTGDQPPHYQREKKLSCVRSSSLPHGSQIGPHHRWSLHQLHQCADCPPERIQFYKSFSAKLRASSKDKQRGDYSRLISIEDQIHQRELYETIFLELRAWQNGLQIYEEDAILYQKRQTIPSVIEELMTFNLQEKILKAKTAQDTSNQPSLNIPTLPQRKVSNENEMKTIQSIVESMERGKTETAESGKTSELDQDFQDEMCGCSESLNRLCQDCITKESEAVRCVEALLDKLDDIEHLYPSTRALGVDHHSYNSPDLVARIKTLNLWLNITNLLRRKIDLLAKLFGLKDRVLVGWPCYEDCCNQKTTEQPAQVVQLKTLPPKFNILRCRSIIVDSSPTTSSSDASDRYRGSGPVSPEINLACPFDTPSSSASSGYQSAPLPQHSLSDGGTDGVQIYRKYVDKTLKHKGLKHIYMQLASIFRPILLRVHQALKQPKLGTYASAASSKPASYQKSTTVDDPTNIGKDYDSSSSLSNSGVLETEEVYGVWSEPFLSMALPTFHRPFLFLLRVPLDVVHACVKLRLQQQPDEPSALSIGQIVKECKEVLRAGVQIRQRYVNLAQTVLGDSGTEVVEGQLEAFDEDLKCTLQAYLRYLEQRMLMLQKVAHFTTLRHKSYLEEEWAFVRQHCPHIPGGEAVAANKFCFMASDLLGSIGHSLESGIDECFMFFYDSASSEKPSAYKKRILQSCRKFKHVFKDFSERSRQGIAFAKTLRKDLEIATEFKNLVSPADLMVQLCETGHIRVMAPHSSSHVMFVPGHLRYKEPYIWQLVDMTCGHESPENLSTEQEGYLILMRCESRDAWAGPTLILEPTAEATITLSHVEVDGVLLVVNHSSQLMNQCRKFQRVMGSTLQVDKQQTSCNHFIAEALDDLKSEALGLRNKMCQVLSEVEEKLTFDVGSHQTEEWALLQARGREVLHQGYNFGFEYQKAVSRLITGEVRKLLGLGVISFAKQWMKFVSEKCERGRGLRPRWANQGLDFLVTASEPQYTQMLTQEEFQEWKRSVKDCVSHLMGERTVEESQVTSPTHHRSTVSRLSFSGPGWHRTASHSRSESTPTTPPPQQTPSTGTSVQVDGNLFFTRRESKEDPGSCVSSTNWSEDDLYVMEKQLNESRESALPVECVRKAIVLLELKQQRCLQERGVIGCVSEQVVQQAPVHISARRVNFSWQRGFKIGEGRFGKVYTAVNNETGELIAMKEIKLQPNDHRAIKEALDEIRTFEGIKHPNLVRYYGVEMHRDEMLIFMEYCNEGSLESMAQLMLPESLIRKYTRQLLEALNTLHDHAIVHRDVKSANIFLTTDGALKLGDFGCCIKLKNHTTMAGELHGFVGTPAYMAPEVFTRNNSVGHGRAADIWSVGCVVYEMASGKRPWHELDSSYQIMFRVGMGETPEIPESLSQEGQDFLSHCLQNDPSDRWTASQLLDHPFTKVNEDDDS